MRCPPRIPFPLPRAIDLWLPGYVAGRRSARHLPPPEHVMLCVCDHFEPLHGTDKPGAVERVGHWRRAWPEIANAFRDAGGVPVRHTFFYPIEQYDRDILGPIEKLCGETGAEVEIHLHHDNDTADGLRGKLRRGIADLAGHGFLARDPDGSPRFGFIHGNWALDDSHPCGRGCGVRDELKILRECGCYADFTMPSAPDRCQTRIVNAIYYAADTPGPKSHDWGSRVRAGKKGAGDLLMVQGPLRPDWRRRKFGVLPRIENGDLTGANPPTLARMRSWAEVCPRVEGRPEWGFIKLHTHGGIPRNFGMLLGQPMRAFHGGLAGEPYRVHYVSARELANIVHAAEDGCGGDPSAYREYRYRKGVPATLA